MSNDYINSMVHYKCSGIDSEEEIYAPSSFY